jgi:hypothetical protein
MSFHRITDQLPYGGNARLALPDSFGSPLQGFGPRASAIEFDQFPGRALNILVFQLFPTVEAAILNSRQAQDLPPMLHAACLV